MIIALAAILLCVVAISLVLADDAPSEESPVVRTSSAGPVTVLPSCDKPQLNRAITFYRQGYRASREAMWLEGPVPRVWYRACDALQRRAVEWRDRAGAAREAFKTWWTYQYDWREWLPRSWYGVGSCETGYGGPPNWQHDSGTYQGAFGFHYDSWDGFVGSADPKAGPYPASADVATPRQQYEVALAIYRRYGLSGWGCRGAYYSWG